MQSLQCLISSLTQGGKGGHLFRLSCSVLLWGGRNTANKYHWHVWGVLPVSQTHWVYPHSQCVCFPSLHCLGSRLLCGELSEAGPGLYALPRSKPLRFGYSTEAQTWLGLSFVPFPGPSSSGDQLFGERGCCDLLSPPSLQLSFLGVQLAHLLRQMLTVQNPKKSWLATKPTCSLVDNASLGLQLPPSGSGCLSPEGDGLQPASSVQSFVL